jgi:RNA polymerase sigma factor (sigma-70 family)
VDLVELDDALRRLESLDPGKVRIVELRFFAGMTLEETARALGISTATVSREWNVARLRLLRELDENTG